MCIRDSSNTYSQVFSEKDVEVCSSKFKLAVDKSLCKKPINEVVIEIGKSFLATEYVAHTLETCLLYTSDAADERSSVDLGGRRIIKKKKNDS